MRRRAGRRRPAAATTAAWARSAAASACSSTSVSRPDSTATVTRSACWGLPLMRVDEPVAQPADAGLERAQQLAGADELLPAGEHLAAQQRAVGGGADDVGDRLRRRRRRRRALSPRRSRSARGRRRRRGRLRRVMRADGAVEGLAHDLGARVDVVGQRLEPGADLGDVVGRQQPVLVDLALGDDEERRVLEAAAGEHPRQVGRDGLDRLVGRAVEDDRDRGRPLGGLLEEAPRHLVGVARGRGDEQPQVGGGQQLGGEQPVALLDRVDVGGVEDREARAARTARATSWSESGSSVVCWTRTRSGSSRSWPNQWASSGWCTSTGERVVGRSTPGVVTRSPTSELTSVDLPAPVEPPTTASSGASRVISRGMT